MISLLRNIVTRSLTSVMPPSSFASQLPQATFFGRQLLVPNIPTFLPTCGYKQKGKVRRRCKDCFMVWREQRLYVLCKTHPRHKQMSMVKKPKNTWLLTHATQSKVRPY